MIKYNNPIVIGCGIIGNSVIYHLARLGYSVKWFDPMPNAWFSTSRAAGMIVHKNPENYKHKMTIQTTNDIYDLERTLGENLNFIKCGSFHFKSTDKQKYVTYNHLDGYIDPVILAGAYKRASTNYELIDKKIEGLIIKDGSVVGVKTNMCKYYGDVIDCTGSWLGQFALSERLIKYKPFLPIKSHYFIINYIKSLQLPFVLTNDFYIKHNGNNEYLLGIYEKKSGYYESAIPLDRSALDTINIDDKNRILINNYEMIEHFFPSIDKVEIKDYIVGYSNYTPDGNYLIGKVCDGLYFAGGDCGSGISSSGGFGHMIANKNFIPDYDPLRFDGLSSKLLKDGALNARKNKF